MKQTKKLEVKHVKRKNRKKNLARGLTCKRILIIRKIFAEKVDSQSSK